jgi:2-desacetyl-2-hydroxyethyl bacteriochlorophyllide A dehydrogenase
MTGHRVVWPGQGQVAIEEFHVPEPADEEVLVATECTLISPGTERAFLLGLPNAQQPYPIYPGYSNVGRVVAAGKRVREPAIGDRVVSSQGHTSHFAVPAAEVMSIPHADLPSEAAAFFNLCAISLEGVRKSQLEIGESALVLGLGPIGLLAGQAARLAGGLPVIGVDPVPERRDLAEKTGADHVLDPQDAGFASRLAEIGGGNGPVVVIEAAGHPQAVRLAFEVAGWHGRVVLLASTRGETEKVNFYRDVHKKGLTVIGAHNYVRPKQDSSPHFWTERDDWRLVLRLLAHRRFQVEPLITHRLPWREAEKAYRLLMNRDPGLLGVLLRWAE